MAKKVHKPEEIVSKLRQVDVLHSQGMSMADAIRQIGVTEVTFYRWRKEYNGMKTDQLKRLKELEKENERLRRTGVGSDAGQADPERGGGGKCMVRPGCASVISVCAERLRQSIRPRSGATWLRASMGIRMPNGAFY